MRQYFYKCDVAVVGAGPAGLAAAVCAAREGKKVILLEKNGFLGGNLTTGLPPLGILDENFNKCMSGFAEELISRMEKRGSGYGTRYCPKHNSVSNMDAEALKIESIKMCKEAGVDIILHVETARVNVENKKIQNIVLIGKCNEVTIEAKQYIDCTGDGDVAYLAGCSYKAGRDETGVLMPPTVMCTLEGVDLAKLYDYIEKNPDEIKYSASIDQREGLDADFFRGSPNHIFVGMTQLFKRLKDEGKLPVNRESMIIINGLHPGEVYCNSTRILNTDATDIMSLTAAEIEGQTELEPLIEVFRNYVPGFENCWISSICPNLGVRETRRILGIKTLTVDDALAGVVPEDSICLSGYKMDIHNGKNATTWFKTIPHPFGVPYGTLVAEEIDNLLMAGRCISVDACVIGSTRVMSTCMCEGQAAGIAAAMSVDANIKPRDVNVADLRAKLLKGGAILHQPEYDK